MARFAADAPDTLARTHRLKPASANAAGNSHCGAYLLYRGAPHLHFGGADYVPGSVLPLRLLVLSIPIGFMPLR